MVCISMGGMVETIIPKNGSLWTAYERKNFRVLSTVEVDGKTWIHYISEGDTVPQEYSCYLESFLSRFNEIPA